MVCKSNRPDLTQGAYVSVNEDVFRETYLVG